ncbi:IclR family transcriptional regulator [Cognatishimia maritima]|uniref:Transcriptional regulator, IclR family n=1 Tax=Cognatishimia maritima TaxID=870908 RepID=A0A1M5S6F4_9RHOB|nr:IclR family transcriptional regulator [Cognatishimia maritima]SHH34069.1 transcriptional regulator, IclR family [Cognatishimia maritima]
MADGTGKEGGIPTNLRLLLVLEAMAKAGVPVTPTEVNQPLGLPKPTIHRLFSTLEAEGFIQREIDGRAYSPGLRVRQMSTGIISSLRIRTARVAVLAKLADQVGETCNIALPDRDAMIYLDRVETKWPLRIQLPIGTRVPFYCTASGKMYLSSLDNRHLKNYANATPMVAKTKATITRPDTLIEEIRNIREVGYSLDRCEFMDGMTAVAVPILDGNGRLVSTLSVHAPEQRFPLPRAVEYVGLLQECATQLSDLLH